MNSATNAALCKPQRSAIIKPDFTIFTLCGTTLLHALVCASKQGSEKVMATDTSYWIAISRLSGIGARRALKLKNHFGSGAEVWRASAAEWCDVLGMSRERQALLSAEKQRLDPEMLAGQLSSLGIWALSADDSSYPEGLLQLFDPPTVLFGQGPVPANRRHCLAVVGARRMTAYGRAVVASLIQGLSGSDAVIVSGLARGIDGEAHRAALAGGLATWAVLGSGLQRVYPPEHRLLAAQILEQGGSLLSEYWPDTDPAAYHFPARNRIIAALAEATLVVEADEKSGSLITVDHALELGRDVYAVPGNVTSRLSRGTNRLIREGARLVASAQDILSEWGILEQATDRTHKLSSIERLTWSALSDEPKTVDEVLEVSGLSAAEVLAALMSLQLKGLVLQVASQCYARVIGE